MTFITLLVTDMFAGFAGLSVLTYPSVPVHESLYESFRYLGMGSPCIPVAIRLRTGLHRPGHADGAY